MDLTKLTKEQLQNAIWEYNIGLVPVGGLPIDYYKKELAQRESSTMNWYEVTDVTGSTYHYQANSSNQAKRKHCRWSGRVPSCPWTGITSLKARKIDESELPWNHSNKK